MFKKITIFLLSITFSMMATAYTSGQTMKDKHGLFSLDLVVSIVSTASGIIAPGYASPGEYDQYSRAFVREYSELTRHRTTINSMTEALRGAQSELGLLSARNKDTERIAKLERKILNIETNLIEQEKKLLVVSNAYKSRVKSVLKFTFKSLPHNGVDMDAFEVARSKVHITRFFYGVSTVFAIHAIYTLATDAVDEAGLDEGQTKIATQMIKNSLEEIESDSYSDTEFKAL